MKSMTRAVFRNRSVNLFSRTLLALAVVGTLGTLPGSVLAAQDITLSYGKPADVGMSAAVLDGAVGLYREAVERGDVVGAVLLVARRGKVVLHEAVGWRNKQEKLPMEKNTMFRMASNTKPVIATAVSILVERGKLRYSDNVRQYIPSFDNYRSGFIQVQHLLSHTSGFRINPIFLQPLMQSSAEHADAPNLRLEVDRFGELGASVLPGTSYSYSNPGFNTLGAVIEIAAGKNLEAFLKEEIYRPLGMSDSYNHEVAEKLDGKLPRMSAVYYEKKNGDWVPGWKPGDPPQYPFVRASGGLISTAWDYAIFCQMFLNAGVYNGVRILKPESVKLMTSPHTDAIDVPGGRSGGGRGFYGYGWFVREDGVYSHGGSDGTFAWVDPRDQVIGLVFTQTPRGRNPRDRFQDLVALSIYER
ncbi:MAG: beta-lactamase family protein [Gemmatimonadetes bacterium]|nr:beta-lactamase family protein [Gemmatimonadota bacterium]